MSRTCGGSVPYLTRSLEPVWHSPGLKAASLLEPGQSRFIQQHWPLVLTQRLTTLDFCQQVALMWSLVARFMGPTWGPSGADRTQVGPMLAPWTLLSGMVKLMIQAMFNTSQPEPGHLWLMAFSNAFFVDNILIESIIWANGGLVHHCIYASFLLAESRYLAMILT